MSKLEEARHSVYCYKANQQNIHLENLRKGILQSIIFLISICLTACQIKIGIGTEAKVSEPDRTAFVKADTPHLTAQLPDKPIPIVEIASTESSATPIESPDLTKLSSQDEVSQLPTPTAIPSLPSIIPASSPPDHIFAPTINLDGVVLTTTWTMIDMGGQLRSVWMVPDNAAGWHINSGLPGHGTNIVISGHHNLGTEIFRNLINLQIGDQIALRADNRNYYYTVTDRFVLPERNVSDEQREQNAHWIQPTTEERVTLITCWPHNDNSHRLIVIAKPDQSASKTDSYQP